MLTFERIMKPTVILSPTESLPNFEKLNYPVVIKPLFFKVNALFMPPFDTFNIYF